MSYNFEIIDDESGFRRAVEAIRGEPVIGFDLESNGFFRYPERICLVQISNSAGAFLIDPLAISDLAPLGEILADADVETVLHAGSYDILSLDRDWGFRVERLFDTSIAAAFAGQSRLGLASVLDAVLGVAIPKEKKLQRSDWTRRPLTDEALAYAAEDVRHLLDLRHTLGRTLRRLGRTEWVEEECRRLAATRYEPPVPEMSVFNVKGWRDLDGRGLAILKALVDYRELHAIRMGRPHFRVIPDMALVTLAAEPDADLRGVRGLGRFGRGRLAAGIRKAIAKGRTSQPPSRPTQPPSRHLSRSERVDADRRLTKLKAWRVQHGKRLSLDPALLWPTKSLQRLARDVDDLDAELRDPDIRHWQRAEFEDSIRKAL